MYETCACVIHTSLHTLSAACALVLSSYINVCVGYMCLAIIAAYVYRVARKSSYRIRFTLHFLLIHTQ